MIARIRKSMEEKEEKDQGFTLIELLVVMIIIGILAAIAIPVFLNQKKKAAETAAKADATAIGKEMAAYYVDGTTALTVTGSNGTWTMTANSTPVTTGKLSTGNAVTTKSKGTNSDTWCVAVDPAGKEAGAAIWSYSATNGLAQGDCP